MPGADLLLLVWVDLKIQENFLFPSLHDHDVFYGYATTFSDLMKYSASN